MLGYGSPVPQRPMPKGPSITYRISEPIKVALDKRMEVTRETPTEVMNLALMKLLKLC